MQIQLNYRRRFHSNKKQCVNSEIQDIELLSYTLLNKHNIIKRVNINFNPENPVPGGSKRTAESYNKCQIVNGQLLFSATNNTIKILYLNVFMFPPEKLGSLVKTLKYNFSCHLILRSKRKAMKASKLKFLGGMQQFCERMQNCVSPEILRFLFELSFKVKLHVDKGSGYARLYFGSQVLFRTVLRLFNF